MNCHKCGEKTDEETCKNCGTRIVKEDSLILASWRNEVDFNKIIRHPDVLDLIQEYSKKSKSKLSAEKFIDLVSESVMGIPLGFLAEVIVPIYSRFGIKTGKSDLIMLNKPIQEVFVKAMCSLVKNNHPIEEFHVAKDGLILVGGIKSDFRSWGGKVIIEFHDNNGLVAIIIQAAIKGQLYDWGKSNSSHHF